MFQGNEGTFEGVDDTEERILDFSWRMAPVLPFNTFNQERNMKQQVFKVVNGDVKDPVLESGFNGRYGYFTGDDTIISFNEESAQTFLADIEGRNTVKEAIAPHISDRDEYINERGGESEQFALARIAFRNRGETFPFGFIEKRLVSPPTLSDADSYEMYITVDGDDSIEITGEGGHVDSYALALDNKSNPNNEPETAQERTKRERSSN